LLFIVALNVKASEKQLNTAQRSLFGNADTSRPTSFFDFSSLKKNIIEFLSPDHFKYAVKLGVPVEDVYDLGLFGFLNDWYKTKYRFGGKSKSGIDCSGFVQQLFSQVYAVGLPRTVPEQFTRCQQLKREELKPGDLVFFHTTRAGLSHVGVYIGNDRFVHSSTRIGVTIDKLSDAYYQKSFRHGGRVVGQVPTSSKR
jgi:hypothetical protein